MNWEEFAKLTAAGAKRADAYLNSGFQVKSKTGQERRKAAQQRASSLLRDHPEIGARVEELKTELRENALAKASLDRNYVIGGLQENFSRAMQTEPVYDRDGKPTGEFQWNGSVANRSMELMGKELGMFADRMIVGSLDAEIESMTVDQIREFIKGACTEVGLRMVDMNPVQTRDWIITNAPKVGLRVEAVTKEAEPLDPSLH